MDQFGFLRKQSENPEQNSTLDNISSKNVMSKVGVKNMD